MKQQKFHQGSLKISMLSANIMAASVQIIQLFQPSVALRYKPAT